MKVKEVSFRRLKSFGQFEHVGIELKANVEKGESPGKVLAKLQEMVDSEVSKQVNAPMIDYMSSAVERLKRELEEVNEKLAKKTRELAHVEGLLAEQPQEEEAKT